MPTPSDTAGGHQARRERRNRKAARALVLKHEGERRAITNREINIKTRASTRNSEKRGNKGISVRVDRATGVLKLRGALDERAIWAGTAGRRR